MQNCLKEVQDTTPQTTGGWEPGMAGAPRPVGDIRELGGKQVHEGQDLPQRCPQLTWGQGGAPEPRCMEQLCGSQAPLGIVLVAECRFLLPASAPSQHGDSCKERAEGRRCKEESVCHRCCTLLSPVRYLQLEQARSASRAPTVPGSAGGRSSNGRRGCIQTAGSVIELLLDSEKNRVGRDLPRSPSPTPCLTHPRQMLETPQPLQVIYSSA